ncbi:RNA-binding protein [Mucilaginibacter daejeonensis]|uniref:RNA recognition motif domain-containing protein n=1 Tax=Mucilaginibacter daejeonensis TaxID=398049 RepID=UPI001D1737D3|nr:RNA-binding protein [Mucilaginibacter daejeonensis]UEG51463.1 RNA-binding protein [Mucilaginibacter daejeonensis]
MIKLFVSGFPLGIDEMALAKLIAPHGDIATIKLVRDRQTRICKGYAFVEMASLTDAENAIIALDGVVMQDRELTVKINEDKSESVRPRFNKPSGQYSKTSYNRSNESRDTLTDDTRAKRPRRPRV